MALKLETDSPDIINQMILAARKCGRLAVVGVYVGHMNHFNIGG